MTASDLILDALLAFVAFVLLWLMTGGVVVVVGRFLYGRPTPSGPRQAPRGPAHPLPKRPPGRHARPKHPAPPRGLEVPPRPTTPPPVPVHDADTVTFQRLPKEHAA